MKAFHRALLGFAVTLASGCGPASESLASQGSNYPEGGGNGGGAGSPSQPATTTGGTGSGGALGGGEGGGDAAGAGGDVGAAGSGVAGAGGTGGAMMSVGAPGNSKGWKPAIGYDCPSIPKPACNAADPTSYAKNTGNLGTHDPAVFADATCNFYQVATHSIMPSKKSTDLVAWSSYSSPSFTLPGWTNRPDIWAADGTFANGKYWIYYSLWHGDIPSAQVGMIFNTTLDASSPNYKWEDGGLIVDRTNGGNASPGGSNVNIIDPNLFIDDDGSWWMIYGSFNDGVRVIPLDNTTGKPKDNPVKPLPITDHLGEGSSLIKYKNYYYVFVSRGKCCSGTSSSYEVVYARSTSVTGPYTTKSGKAFSSSSYTDATDALMRVGFEGNTGGEGGQQFFRVNGQWYVDYHAYAPSGTNLVVRPVYFDSSGWATFDCTKAD